MKVPALFLERAVDGVESTVGAPAPFGRCCVNLRDVVLKHLEIVEPSKLRLRTLESPDRSPCRRHSSVCGKLQRVAQLLGGDPHLVEPLGRIDETRCLHGGREASGAFHDPEGKHFAPLLDTGLRQDGTDRAKPSSELFGVHVIEPLEHQGAPIVARVHHVRADVFQGVAGNARPPRQLVQDVERDVELTHRSERSRQPPDFAAGLPGFRAFHACRQHRHRFPQPAGGHARLMDPVVVATNGGRQIPLEGACPPCQ